MMADFDQDRFENFSQFFHPRSRAPVDIGSKIQSILSGRYDKRWEFSLFRVWRIRSEEGRKAILDDCAEADGAKIVTMSGFDSQYVVWIQILAQNELGRLFFIVAPDKGKLSIVSFRIQQWTQLGFDSKVWAQKAAKEKNPIHAYFAYDIAQKLLSSDQLIIFPEQADLVKKRDEFFTQEALVKEMNSALKINSIVYVGSLMTKEETGIFLREAVNGQDDSKKLRDLCLQRGKDLLNLGILRPKESLRCNYIFKGMDPQKDSPLGGQIFTSNELKGSQR